MRKASTPLRLATSAKDRNRIPPQNRHLTHLVRTRSSLEQPWRVKGLFEATDKLFRRKGLGGRCRSVRDRRSPDNRSLEGTKGRSCCRPTMRARWPLTPSGTLSKLVWAGNDADLMPGGEGEESAGGGIGTKCFERPENDGVVGQEEIVSASGQPPRPGNRRGPARGVSGAPVAAGSPTSRPTLSQSSARCSGVISCSISRKCWTVGTLFVLSKEKEAHP